MATLLAESGSTKTDWVLIDGSQQGLSFQTSGLNPSYLAPEQMVERLKDEFPSGVEDIRHVHFYGAGCSSAQAKGLMKAVLEHFFVQISAHVEHDLLAAARGLLGSQPGFVCILGTGSHACYFDGEAITDEAVSLGYLLGDEGSGCRLGMRLVRDYLYGIMPSAAAWAFGEVYSPERDAVIDRIYRQPGANRWLAHFARFLADCPDHAYAHVVLQGAFADFIRTHLLPLYQKQPGPICFTGSIAWHFQEELGHALDAAGFPKPIIAKSPLQGLVQYHQSLQA